MFQDCSEPKPCTMAVEDEGVKESLFQQLDKVNTDLGGWLGCVRVYLGGGGTALLLGGLSMTQHGLGP